MQRSTPYSRVSLALYGVVLGILASIAAPSAADNPASRRTFGKIPLRFVENRGQVDVAAPYYVEGRETAVYFRSNGLTLALHGPRPAIDRDDGGIESAKFRGLRLAARPESPARGPDHVLDVEFVAANPDAGPFAEDPAKTVVSYFIGPRERWKTGLRTFGTIVYHDVWPGIDLVYSGGSDHLKYEFVVAPGADPDAIRLAYHGALGLRIDGEGALEVATPLGTLRDQVPYAYQDVDGQRLEIPVGYVLEGADLARGPDAGEAYGFFLGPYDRRRTLIVDPAMLVYAGYIGTSGNDRGLGIAVDDAGYAYVTGEVPFPVTAVDALITKVEADGSDLVYVAFLGGNGYDAGFDIVVDDLGFAYLTGATTSNQLSFPLVVGPDLTFNGAYDCFVAKVNPSGTQLVYSGYIGGSGTDFGEGMAVDDTGNAFVTGITASGESTFPVALGPDLTFNGGYDTFVAKVNPVGTGLVYAGYIGGDGDDVGVFGDFVTAGHIAVDSSGSAYVSGMTTSGETTFPVTVGPDLTFNGGYDAYVAKVVPAGTGLEYAGYIGGSGDDYGFGMAVDDAGNAFLSGMTDSDETTFPVTLGPDLTYNGEIDAMIAKVNAAGTGLAFAGYIGGADLDQGLGLALGAPGSVFVVGHTHSDEDSFPAVGGPDTTLNGIGSAGDAFVAKLHDPPDDPDVLNNFDYCGYIGGAAEDAGLWIDVDLLGSAYVVGDTASDETTFPVTVGPWLIHNGGVDGFVAKIAQDLLALAFESDKQTLVWTTVGSAQAYNVYRGRLSALSDDDGDGLPDTGYGSCLNRIDDDTTDSSIEDSELPVAADGFTYLVSFVAQGQESGLGVTSSGLTRQVQAPCP